MLASSSTIRSKHALSDFASPSNGSWRCWALVQFFEGRNGWRYFKQRPPFQPFPPLCQISKVSSSGRAQQKQTGISSVAARAGQADIRKTMAVPANGQNKCREPCSKGIFQCLKNHRLN
jgi:hypothetical protein